MATECISTANNYSINTAVCQGISSAVKVGQMTLTKRRGLTQEETEDADRLRVLYDEKKRATGMTQTQIADACGWESQGTVGQYFSKKIPLNLDAAFRFSKALGVPLDAISPRLAARAVELFGATLAGQHRPRTFEDLISAYAEQIAKLNEADRQSIEAMRQSCRATPGSDEKYTKALLAIIE